MSARKITLALAVAAMAGACASYEPSSAPLPARTEFDLTGTAGVLVGADPYVTAEEQEAIFDADLDKSDVIALHLFVENTRASPVLIRPSDMSLSIPGGRAVAPSSATKVANKVGEDGSVIGATIAFGIIGALAASSAEEKARTARVDDYESKSLTTTELAPGAKMDGIVFFIPPKSWPAFDAAELSVRVIHPQSGENWIIPVQLTGLSFEPGDPEK